MHHFVIKFLKYFKIIPQIFSKCNLHLARILKSCAKTDSSFHLVILRSLCKQIFCFAFIFPRKLNVNNCKILLRFPQTLRLIYNFIINSFRLPCIFSHFSEQLFHLQNLLSIIKM